MKTALPLESAPRPVVPATFWGEARTTVLLSLPIAGGQVIQNALGVIDTLMVGRVSVQAVAAASLGTAVFVVPLVFGFGLLGPLSVLISGANARGEADGAVGHLRRGLVVSLAMGLLLAVSIQFLSSGLSYLHQIPEVMAQARPFLLLLAWSIVPMYLFSTLKQYCEALHAAWPPMLLLCAGVFLNIVLNWILIFGHLGAHGLGLLGAGWATLITRTVLLFALAVVVGWQHFRDPSLRHALFHGAFDWTGYRQLLGLGLPAGFQVILEVGLFTFAAIMTGWISDVAQAAHQITITVAATVFMMPLGLGNAVAIRVSHALGLGDIRRARLCVGGALLMIAALMLATGTATCVFAHGLAACFVTDPRVIALGAQLLVVAGLFQIFDGTQVVCICALRGLHDITFPSLLNLVAYWMMALPLCYVLGFTFHLGAVGIWLGLLSGLGILSVLLLLRLWHKLRSA